jgi:hypothetical protein
LCPTSRCCRIFTQAPLTKTHTYKNKTRQKKIKIFSNFSHTVHSIFFISIKKNTVSTRKSKPKTQQAWWVGCGGGGEGGQLVSERRNLGEPLRKQIKEYLPFKN